MQWDAVTDVTGCWQVRKSYEERRRKRHVKGQGRSWKLKRMAMDSDDAMVLKKGQQAQADKRQQDLERFMQVTLSLPFWLVLLGLVYKASLCCQHSVVHPAQAKLPLLAPPPAPSRAGVGL